MLSRRPRSSATFPTANRRSASAKSRSTSSAEAYRCFGSALKKLITSAGASLSSAVCTRSSRVAGYSSCARCHPGLRFGSSPIPLAMSESYSARSRMARSSMLRRGRRSVRLLPGGSADHPPPLFAYPVEVRNLPPVQPPQIARDPQLLHSVREAAQRAGSLEDALRAALQRICAATGWQAGRVEFAQRATENAPRTIWYLEQPDRLDTLKGVAERRRHSDGGGLAGKVLREGAPQWRPGSEDGAGAVFAFPAVARRRTVAAVEFFSTAAQPPDDALLSRITHACAELGRVIEEKPAQEMLRKAERGYRDLFESVSEALIVVDPRTGIIQDANPRACDLYGVPRERMLGISVHGLWSDAGVARAAIARGRRFETVLHRRNFDTVLEVSASPVQYHGQQAALLLSREVTH